MTCYCISFLLYKQKCLVYFLATSDEDYRVILCYIDMVLEWFGFSQEFGYIDKFLFEFKERLFY